MVFPEDFDYERRQAREQRAEWLDISEDMERETGDITVSDTASGRERLPGILGDEADDLEDVLDEEGMHVLDEAELETLEDPFDADGYLDDEDDEDFDEDEDFDRAEDWDDDGLEDAEDTY